MPPIYKVPPLKGCFILSKDKTQSGKSFTLKGAKCPSKGTKKANVLAYGTVNVYELGGKAYYKHGKKMVRAEERDNLISSKPKKKMIFVLQGTYGHGWEDLTAEETREEIRQRLKEYRENEGGNYRIVRKRE